MTRGQAGGEGVLSRALETATGAGAGEGAHAHHKREGEQVCQAARRWRGGEEVMVSPRL